MLAAHNFRGSVLLEGTTIDPKAIKIHPAFLDMSNECYLDIAHISFVDYEDPNFREWPLTSTGVAKDFATDPAVTKIKVQVHNFPAVETKNKHGVTVLQVMRAMCKIFGTKLPARLKHWDMGEYGNGTYRDMMGDHTGWTGHGFNAPRVDSKGTLLLRATSFDS